MCNMLEFLAIVPNGKKHSQILRLDKNLNLFLILMTLTVDDSVLHQQPPADHLRKEVPSRLGPLFNPRDHLHSSPIRYHILSRTAK